MAAPVTMGAVVPEGVAPGGYFAVQTPDNQMIQVQAPEEGGGYSAGSTVAFAYMPMEVGEHPADAALFAEGMAIANAKQQELEAAGAVAAIALPEADFAGFQFQPAMFRTGDSLYVTRSDGSESPCTVTEIFLLAMGPMYTVYLGQAEDGTAITKNAEESDLRKM
eukprot:TRINITY_DN110263_c0_g1_i1.p2 TRINITY_DN110263_c0_g1~~TRINITY_DN110263_c0_g1_i1.p2  ORF type:complete len:165 (+),score=43.33 TRINITY_DN110263_c0_g1_i1:91-585(+)